jgi:hypothetical protein
MKDFEKKHTRVKSWNDYPLEFSKSQGSGKKIHRAKEITVY